MVFIICGIQRTGISKETDSELQQEVLLPEIEEIDWQYGRRFFKDDSGLKEAAMLFYRRISQLQDKLEKLYNDIENEVGEYEIEVHAIKSTSGMFGALTLSKLAKLLEQAASDKDILKITALHPVFMEQLELHRQRLSVLESSSTEDKLSAEVSEDMKTELIQEIKNAVEKRDIDEVDELVEKLAGCMSGQEENSYYR
ncbi:MAG: Hpt domain-containing protein [Lachnospiraceae bacterium]|nr:Hpt domain-containing protein [Lachnospiraceae bacterium]